MKLVGNSSYTPLGASYTAQGPQKQAEIMNDQLFIFQNISKNRKPIKNISTPIEKYKTLLNTYENTRGKHLLRSKFNTRFLMLVNLSSFFNCTRNGLVRS